MSIEPFNNAKPGPINESWKLIFALEKRINTTCNKADDYCQKLTALAIKKREIEKEESQIEVERSINKTLRASLNLKVNNLFYLKEI